MNATPKPSLRVTNQAQTVFAIVKQADGHVTADQVYEQARKTLPRISLGTVYRNLDQLTDRNLISRVTVSGVSHYEPYQQPHYHVVCQACRRIDDLPTNPASDIEDYFSRATNYKLTGHELILYGVCPNCQKIR